ARPGGAGGMVAWRCCRPPWAIASEDCRGRGRGVASFDRRRRIAMSRYLFLGLLCCLPLAAQAADCPPLLAQQGHLQKLRSKVDLDLCGLDAGKSLLVVNIASHCGFSSQFKGLE